MDSGQGIGTARSHWALDKKDAPHFGGHVLLACHPAFRSLRRLQIKR